MTVGVCCISGCPELTERSYCTTHAKAKRSPSSQRTGTRAFQRTAQRIIARDGCCVYCGTGEALTVDHVIPVSAGGTDHDSNLVTACRSCNSGKGARGPEVVA